MSKKYIFGSLLIVSVIVLDLFISGLAFSTFVNLPSLVAVSVLALGIAMLSHEPMSVVKSALFIDTDNANRVRGTLRRGLYVASVFCLATSGVGIVSQITSLSVAQLQSAVVVLILPVFYAFILAEIVYAPTSESVQAKF